MLLSAEVDGFGFALACDFLKELGYFNFGKPDVQIKDIFKGLGLVDQAANDYQVFKAISRVAKSNSVTAYHVDKLFWLVGSGFLYNDKTIGVGGRIGTDRSDFILSASAALR